MKEQITDRHFRESCRGCYYHRPFSSYRPNGDWCCHYQYETGESRDCPPENCNKKLLRPYRQQMKGDIDV